MSKQTTNPTKCDNRPKSAPPTDVEKWNGSAMDTPSSSSHQSLDQNGNLIQLHGCPKVNFLELLTPKPCKISKINPSCCPFSSSGGCNNRIKGPICSWFASPKYYHHTCARSTRPQCCKTKCWYYKAICGDDGYKLTLVEEDGEGQEEQTIAVQPKLSSNTLHGMRSVSDLRAWSICCEDQRRYFLEQMVATDNSSAGNGNEGQLEDTFRDEDAPFDASAIEMKYEKLLKIKDEEIERLKNRIRELEGQPARPPPSSTRLAGAEGMEEASALPDTVMPSGSTPQPESQSGDKKSREDLADDELEKTKSTGGILVKTKSTLSAKGVTIEDSPPKKESLTSVSVADKSSKSSIKSRKSNESAESASRKASETRSRRSSETSKSGVGVAASVTKIPSTTKSQKSIGSAKSDSAGPSRKGSLKSPSSESIKKSESKSGLLSRIPSSTKSRKSSTDSKSKEPTADEQQEEVSRKPSSTKSQKSNESNLSESKNISEDASQVLSQKSVQAEDIDKDEVSQKSSTKSQNEEDNEAVSGKASDTKSQRSSISGKSGSKPASGVVSETEFHEENEKEPSKKSSKQSQKSNEGITSSESEPTGQDASEDVKSGPTSRKASDAKSLSSEKSGEINKSLAEEENEDGVSSSKALSRKESSTSQKSGGSALEKQTDKKESGSGVGSRRGSQLHDVIPEEDENEIFADKAEQAQETTDKPKPVSYESDNEPDLFEDEPAEDILLDDIHPVTSSEELSEELYFIEPGSEGVEVSYTVLDGVMPEGEDQAKEGSGEALAEVFRQPRASESKDELGFGDTPPPILTEKEKDDLLGDIYPLQSNESLCMELNFVERPSEVSDTTSKYQSSGKPSPVPQIRPMSLAEIGGYEEKRTKFLECACVDMAKPKFARKEHDMNCLRVVIENNKIQKVKGFQVIEELDPESLVTEVELLRLRIAAQQNKISELERALYNGIGIPNNVETNAVALLRHQLATLEVVLAERENSKLRFSAALEGAIKERDTYRQQLMRIELTLKEYESIIVQLQQRLQTCENRANAYSVQPAPASPSPASPIQEERHDYPNYLGGGARGPPNHLLCLRR